MYAVTTEDEELVGLIANTGKQEAAAPANKDDQRALEIAQVHTKTTLLASSMRDESA